jgi:death-on-curing protein
MMEPKWVLEEVVLAIHTMLLSEHGGATGIRDEAMLQSALSRAPQKFAYEEDASHFDLAAAYSFGLAKNHPLIDGNKRVAFTVGVLSLEFNGYEFVATEADATITFESLAASKVDEKELSRWFEMNVARSS